ncbi:MAG TPA: hypothetical protein VGJ02_08570 [Pyrinomonadaceae bacterium]|jgi:hypothetical protein
MAMRRSGTAAAIAILCFCTWAAAQRKSVFAVGGTLVVAVPVQQGLVVCSDKRLYNDTAGTYRDDFVKIHQVGRSALFVATHTTGFLNKTTGKMDFDIFEITSRYVAQHSFVPDQRFWDGLKMEIHDQLTQYLSKLRYEDQPETDTANNKLLFNLVFYSIEGNAARSYSMSVFYEKARTPIIFTPGVVTETVRTPKLTGKGKDVMAYLSGSPSLSRDPSILRFDESNFKIAQTSIFDAVDFAKKLFVLTSTALPQAEVSATYDCALLDYQNGFRWLTETGQPRP